MITNNAIIANGRQIDSCSIFGEYSKAEDRVTCALLHIINYAGKDLLEKIINVFGEYLPSSDNGVYTQCSLSGKNLTTCVADGFIRHNCNYCIAIECKLGCFNDALPHNLNQLSAYKSALGGPAIDEYIIYITADTLVPSQFDDTIFWMNWDKLIILLDEFLDENKADNYLAVLISEFKKLIDNNTKSTHKRALTNYNKEDEKQIREIVSKTLKDADFDLETNADELVVVVGGRWGENVALKFGFYACQYERFFSQTKYLAFYYNNRIKFLFEIIGAPKDVDNLQDPSLQIDQSYFVYDKNCMLGDKRRRFFRLKLVKEFDDPGIQNDSKDKNGKTCAYVQHQRYTTLAKICSAKFTSEL